MAQVEISDEAVEAVVAVLIGLDHTDDYIRGFGAEVEELEQWELNSARSAARDLILAMRSVEPAS